MSGAAPFEGFPLERRIAERASACGFELGPDVVGALAAHARRVLQANAALHLTTIVDPEEFIERHVGESFEGAALLSHETAGSLVDLGSGNGYPALPIAAAHRALKIVLVDASTRKAAFLRELLESWHIGAGGEVLERQVQRPRDLEDVVDPIRVLTCRAVGGWERLIPKIAQRLASDGSILLWAGDGVEAIARRSAWRKLQLVERRRLPGRERAAVWLFRPSSL